MNDLLIGLLSAWVATNQPAALSNLVQQKTGLAVSIPDPNDPVEKEYQKVLEEDDLAHEEVDQWILARARSEQADDAVDKALLNSRIEQRLAKVRKAYDDFLFRHPDHQEGRLAYGSFLSGLGDEQGAAVQWEKARTLDPKNPASWNNLANYYGHNGPVTNAFDYYAKAIELSPNESVYHYNFATTVFLFRQDAITHFGIDEQAVFDKAMKLYHRALELDPKNFTLATEVAQTYYGIKPPQTGRPEADRQAALAVWDQALAAWNYALSLATDDKQRQGIYIHFARLQINAGRFAEARENLNKVTDPAFDGVKGTLLKNLAKREAELPSASDNASTK